jgi:hypothetical protein
MPSVFFQRGHLPAMSGAGWEADISPKGGFSFWTRCDVGLELVINGRTALMLGIAVLDKLLVAANEVIE